jgi:hypothetical protein
MITFYRKIKILLLTILLFLDYNIYCQDIITKVDYYIDSLKRIGVYSTAETMPTLKDTLKSFQDYFLKHFKYAGECSFTHTKIIISFIIDQNGKAIEANLIQGLGCDIDQEIIEFLKKIPNWNPAKIGSVYVPIVLIYPLTLEFK